MPPSSRSLTLYVYAPSFFSFSHAIKLIDLTESYSWQAEAHPWAWVTPIVRLVSPQPCLHKLRTSLQCACGMMMGVITLHRTLVPSNPKPQTHRMAPSYTDNIYNFDVLSLEASSLIYVTTPLFPPRLYICAFSIRFRGDRFLQVQI